MRGFCTIVGNELRGRWPVFVAVMALGWLAPLSPWWVAERGIAAEELSRTTALVLSLLVTLGGALGLGTQMVVDRHVEGRLGFFLARPVSGWALWWGRVVAAMVTLVMCVGLIGLPLGIVEGIPTLQISHEMLADSAFDLPHAVPWDLPAPFAVVAPWSAAIPTFLGSQIGWIVLGWSTSCVLLLLLGHWIAMVLRLRTRWAVLDVLLLAMALWVVPSIVGTLHRLMAFREALLAMLGLVGTLVVGGLWGGGLQVAQGGVRASRGHGLFSGVFWSLTWCFLLLTYGYSQWLLARGPSDLQMVENLHSSPDGEWLVVSGHFGWAGSYEGVFVVRPATGEYVPLGPRLALPGQPIFSRQSNAVAWIDCPLGADTCALEWRRLAERQRLSVPVAREHTALFSTYRNRSLALSEDGRQVAIAFEGRLHVYEAPSGDLLSTRALPSETKARLHFDAEGDLRVGQMSCCKSGQQLEIWRLDLEADAPWRQVASLPGAPMASNADAGRLLMKTPEGELVLFDDWGRQTLARLERASEGDPAMSRVLSTGDVILLETSSPGDDALAVYAADGRLRWRVTLPAGRQALLAGEIAPGKVLVGVRPVARQGLRPSARRSWLPGLGEVADWQVRLLDVDTGWQGQAWSPGTPTWQFGETFEQGRWVLSPDGVDAVEPSPEGGLAFRRVLETPGA